MTVRPNGELRSGKCDRNTKKIAISHWSGKSRCVQVACAGIAVAYHATKGWGGKWVINQIYRTGIGRRAALAIMEGRPHCELRAGKRYRAAESVTIAHQRGGSHSIQVAYAGITVTY